MLKTAEHYPINQSMVASHLKGSKSFGPVTINYDLDLSVPQLSANATLYGQSIGSIVLNPQNPSGTIGGSIGIATAEATLTVDFAKKELLYSIDVEAFGSEIYKGNGILFSW